MRNVWRKVNRTHPMSSQKPITFRCWGNSPLSAFEKQRKPRYTLDKWFDIRMDMNCVSKRAEAASAILLLLCLGCYGCKTIIMTQPQISRAPSNFLRTITNEFISLRLLFHCSIPSSILIWESTRFTTFLKTLNLHERASKLATPRLSRTRRNVCRYFFCWYFLDISDQEETFAHVGGRRSFLPFVFDLHLRCSLSFTFTQLCV